MKSIKKILLAIIFVAIFLCLCSFNSNVQAAIKENSNAFSGDTYVIGSTKFNDGFVITASRAAIAGANEAYMRFLMSGGSLEFDTSEIKTYYYCALDGSWSEVNVENGELKELSETEAQELEESLNIFFVNNEEKTVEVSYSGKVDEDSISGWGNGEATVEEGKIIVPASWVVNGFSFESNGQTVDVTLSNSSSGEDLEELNQPIIKKHPTMTLELKSKEVYVGEPVEFTLSISANDFTGEKLNGNIYCTNGNLQKYEYYNKNAEKWEEVLDYTNVIGTTLKTEEIKYRMTFSAAGNTSINAYMSYDGGYIDASIDDIEVKVSEKAVAQINSKYYEDFATAISEAEDETVTLLKNITITSDIEIDKTIGLELNEKTITIKGNDTRITVKDSGNLTISNGTITSEGYGALRATDSATLNVGSDVTINVVWYGITVRGNATVNYSGVINVSSDGFGISGNGNDKETSTTINVTGGVINAPEGHAFYLPQNGLTTIKDGTFEANTAIGILSGTLNITGGTFIAKGQFKEVSIPTSNGMNPTGDVIFAEINKNYKGSINISIENATLSSANGNIVREYNTTIGSDNELAGITIYGDYTTKTIENNSVTTYTATDEAAIEADGVYYSENSLADALNNAKDVKLLKNVNVSEDIEIDNTVSVNLNERTINIIGKNILTTPTDDDGMGDNTRISAINTAKVTFSNGSIISKGNAALRAINNSTLTVTENVKIEAYWWGIALRDNAKLDFCGEIEVTGDGFGISGNGSDPVECATTINVTGGKIEAPKGHAFFLPQKGTTTITDGTFEADTVIGILSGTLNINGGTFTANGEYKQVSVPTSNGMKPTGDAIFVELNDKYKGNVVVNYTAGTITSTKGKVLREYSVNDKHATINGLVKFGEDTDTKTMFYDFSK